MATYDYTTASDGLDSLQAVVTTSVKQLRQSKQLASGAQSTLDGLGASTAALRTWIDDEATANPDDEAVQDLKRRKDKMVTDFQARKATADAMVADLDSYDP